MLWNILGAAAAAALVVLLIWKLRGLMLTPVRTGQGTELTVRLDVYGPDTSLEGAVAAIKWLRENGTLPCKHRNTRPGNGRCHARRGELPCRRRRVHMLFNGRELSAGRRTTGVVRQDSLRYLYK